MKILVSEQKKMQYRNFQKISIFFIVAFLVQNAMGVESCNVEPADPVLENWRWRQYPNFEGKGLRSILSAQDSSMWFGTQDGVYQYDGYEYTFYGKNEGLIDAPVNALVQASDGSIYAAADSGVSRYFNGKWEWFFPTVKKKSLRANNITESSDGSIWLSTFYGAIRYKNETFTQYIFNDAEKIKEFIEQEKSGNIKDDLQSSVLGSKQFTRKYLQYQKSHWDDFWVYDIIEAFDSSYWFAMKDGTLFHVDLDNEIILDIPENYNEENRPTLFQSRDSTIWLLTDEKKAGVQYLKNGKWSTIRLSEIGGSDRNNDIIELEDGSLWIGGSGTIHVYKNNRWSVYETNELENQIPLNRILFAKSCDGSIWLAGRGHLAARFENSDTNWLSYDGFVFQLQTKDGSEWFLGKDDKLYRNLTNKWSCYSNRDGLLDSPVGLIQTSNGELWGFGSNNNNAAISRFVNSKWETTEFPELSWSIDWRSAFEDKQGNIWFGGATDFYEEKGQVGGVICLKRPTGKKQKRMFVHYKPPIAPNSSYGIGQFQDGRIVVAGYYGIFSFDGFTWVQETIVEGEDKIPGDVIFTDNSARLWFGSRDYGLYYHNGEKWAHFNTNEGIVENRIRYIDEDENDVLWISTANGMFRSYATETEIDSVYWTAACLPSKIPIYDWMRVKHAKDILWINYVAKEWYTRVRFADASRSANKRMFKSIKYQFSKSFPETRVISYQDKVAKNGVTTIHWEGIDKWDKTPKNEIEYSYRLDNSLWSQYSTESSKLFTDLKSGKHTFQVRAKNNDMRIDASPAKVQFTVDYPFYLKFWFLVPLGFLSLLAIYQTNRIIMEKNKLLVTNINLEQEISKKEKAQAELLDARTNLEIRVLARTAELDKANETLKEEVAYRKNAEDLVKASLCEKETLLKEIHHRVKNNLQIIQSLLYLQSKGVKDQKFLDLLKDSQSRIKSMALIHEKLYRSNDLGKINFSDYIRNLADNVLQTFRGSSSNIHLDMAISDVSLTIDTSIPCGLIINELLSNSLKYAFPNNRKGVIHINLSAKDYSNGIIGKEITLNIADDGIGLPKDFDWEKSDSLGLKLVHNLTNQLDGDIKVDGEDGVSYTIKFKVEN